MARHPPQHRLWPRREARHASEAGTRKYRPALLSQELALTSRQTSQTSLNSVNGAWCGQNRELIRGILKGEWSFAGFTLTDGIFGMRDAQAALLAGQGGRRGAGGTGGRRRTADFSAAVPVRREGGRPLGRRAAKCVRTTGGWRWRWPRSP